MIRATIGVFVVAIVCFLSGFYAGMCAEIEARCRATNTEWVKLDECVKRGKP
jgi:hypothetical protein